MNADSATILQIVKRMCNTKDKNYEWKQDTRHNVGRQPD